MSGLEAPSVEYRPGTGTMVKAFDPYYNRGWQSCIYPCKPDEVLVEKVDISKNCDRYDYLLQTVGPTMWGIRRRTKSGQIKDKSDSRR